MPPVYLARISQANKTQDGAERGDNHKNIEECEQVENEAVVFGQEAKAQSNELQVIQNQTHSSKREPPCRSPETLRPDKEEH